MEQKMFNLETALQGADTPLEAQNQGLTSALELSGGTIDRPGL